MRRTWKQRLVSIMAAVILVVTGVMPMPVVLAAELHAVQQAVPGTKAEVTLQIEGYGHTVTPGTTVRMPDEYKTFADYGITGISEPETEGFTVLHAMAEYCVQQGLDPAAEISAAYGYVSGFLQLPQKSTIMFLVNRVPMMTGASEQLIKDGDLISVVDLWFNSSWTAGGQYAWFEESEIESEAGTYYPVIMHTVDTMSGQESSPAGAAVQVYDEALELVTTAQTDSAGKAELRVDVPGNYTITAERYSNEYDTNGEHPLDITRPHCEWTVLPSEEVSDEAAVEQTVQWLTLGDLLAVVSNLSLPESGEEGTEISWETSDPEVITKAGEVQRAWGEDKTAVLTASIRKNQVSAVKEFTVTVKGYSLKLQSLSVSEGTLEFRPEQDRYTVYVGKQTEEIHVTAHTEEADGQVSLFIKDIAALDGGVTVRFPVSEETIDIPIETRKDGNSAFVYIEVKRAEEPGEQPDELPDITWGQHLGGKDNNAVVSAQTPKQAGSLLWESFSNGKDSFGSVYPGTPILLNHTIYAVRDQKLQMLDANTGALKSSAELLSDISYYSNIIYGGGMIFVPLADGRIQSFHAGTLASLYVTEKPGGVLGNYSIYGLLHYDNGVIYAGYTDTGSGGYFAAYDTADTNVSSTSETVEAKWQYGKGSYYGTGPVTVGSNVVTAGDDGVVSVLDTGTGREKGSIKLEGKARGPIVYAEGYLWIATQGKKLYKLSCSAEGVLTECASVGIPLSTNAAPAVAGGKVYLTGGDFISGGFLSVYDSNLKELASTTLTAAANTPTVTTAYEDTYVYFTENGEEGALFAARITADHKITVTKLYVPEHQNYCMSKVVAGADGTLYYGNDSGYLFAVREGAAVPPEPEPQPPVVPGNPEKPPVTLPLRPEERARVVSKGSTSFAASPKQTKTEEKEQDKTVSERIAEAIAAQVEKKEMSLTVKNVPDRLEAAVFEMLSKYPEFNLILDCKTYTLSMKGKDVKHPGASLNTRITEETAKADEAETKQFEQYQILDYQNEGSMPGRATVVYPLKRELMSAKNLYVYSYGEETGGKEALIQGQYVLWYMDEPGKYIITDGVTKEPVTKIASKEETVQPTAAVLQENEERKTPWIPITAAGTAAGICVGAFVMWLIMRVRKKKEGTWEE